jgi:hypothetical protein
MMPIVLWVMVEGVMIPYISSEYEVAARVDWSPSKMICELM